MLSRTSYLIAVASFLPVAASAQDSREVFRGEVPADSWLRLRTSQGDIEVREGSGRTAVVKARVQGSGERPTFEVKRDGASVTICAIYETTTRCDAEGYENRWNRRDGRHASADFIVELPRGVKLLAATGNGDVETRGATAEVRASSGNGELTVDGAGSRVNANTGNGDVEVRGAKGPVDVSSGNGDITVTTTAGPVTASSGNGRIQVSMESLREDGNMSFTTGNGTIELTLPSNLSADIDANVGMRSFESDFPMQLPGRWGNGRIEGKIGNGGRRIRLSTGNGRVILRKNT